MEHKKIDLGNIHKPHNWEFADATARAAAVIADSDLIGALALQLDDGTYWRLTSVGPTVWTKAATPNASDAELRDRATHTGSQAISSVTGLQTALDAAASHAGSTSNPHAVTKAQVGLGNVENKSSADIRSEISSGNVTTALGYAPLAPSAVGDTVASLVAGKVPSSQLPAYVDDVLEYANLAGFPGTGTAGIIYVALDTNKTYRWSGSAYTEISPSPGSTDSVTEGSSNLYFTAARVRDAVLTGLTTVSSAVIAATDSVIGALQKLQAQITAHTSNTSNPHSVTKSQVGLGNVDNTSDANKPISTATQTALDAKFDKSGGTISGPVVISHAAADTNSAEIRNTTATGYGLFVRGGSSTRYAALFVNYDATNQLALLSGDGQLTVAQGVSAPQFQATGGAPAFSTSNQVTGGARGQFQNSGGTFYFGIDNSSGGLSGAYTINYFYTGNYDHVWSINSAEKMRLTTAGSLYNVTGTYGTISDAKLKRDVTDTGPKLPKVLAMRIVNYFLIADPTNTKLLGMIAQELREISPGLVEETPDYEVVEVEPARTDHIPRQRQKTEARTVMQWKVEVRDGVAVRTPVEVIEHVPLFIELPLVGEDGQQIVDLVDGKQVPAVFRQPVMEDYTETVDVPAKIERRATGTSTLSIKYSILVPMLVKAMQELHAEFDSRINADGEALLKMRSEFDDRLKAIAEVTGA